MESLLIHPDGFSLHHALGRSFDLRFQDRSLLGPFTLYWHFGGSVEKPIELSSEDQAVSDIRHASGDQEIRLEYPIFSGARTGVSFRLTPAGLEVRQFLVRKPGDGKNPLPVHFFRLVARQLEGSFLEGLGEAPDWCFFPLAYNSFSPAFVRDSRATLPVPPFPTAAIFNQHIDSPYWNKWSDLSTPWMATIHKKGRPATLLAGFLEARIGLGEIAIRRRRPTWLETRLDFGGKTLLEGEELVGDALQLAFGTDGDGLLEDWTREVARQMNARVPHTEVPSGWCSWYYYYTRVTEADVLKNLDQLDTSRERLPVAYVQLDDGYQTDVGDWLSLNRKFPSGLEMLARRIKEKGFLPGIWTAPFFVQRESRIFRHHRDWLIKDELGRPLWLGYLPTWGVINGHLYGLDPTHHEVLDYLTEVYSTLVKFGFEYFKIDFLFAGLKPGRHFDSSKSPVEAYRMGIARIREVIGDRFLLGCGAPILPSIGVVDAMRISPDVKEAWRDPLIGFLARGAGHPAAELALLNCLTRSHLHNVWWFNDPDCLLVRDKRSSLKLVEVQTLVTVLSLTGGMLFLSDDLDELSLARRDLAELALPPGGSPAKTLGLQEEPYPSRYVRYYVGTSGKQDALAAVINWTDRVVNRAIKATDVGMADGDYLAYEYWSRTYKLLNKGAAFDVTLDPHQTALLLFRPLETRPQLITATHHIGQTSVLLEQESWRSSGDLEVRLNTKAKREGQVLIAVPKGFRVADVRTEGGAQITGKSNFDGGLRLSVPISSCGTLHVRFQRDEA